MTQSLIKDVLCQKEKKNYKANVKLSEPCIGGGEGDCRSKLVNLGVSNLCYQGHFQPVTRRSWVWGVPNYHFARGAVFSLHAPANYFLNITFKPYHENEMNQIKTVM